MHERFLESPPYDLGELKAKAEGILRVEDSRRQIAKNAVIAVSQNNSQSRGSRDYYQKPEEDSRMARPSRDTTKDKRKTSDFPERPAKK